MILRCRTEATPSRLFDRQGRQTLLVRRSLCLEASAVTQNTSPSNVLALSWWVLICVGGTDGLRIGEVALADFENRHYVNRAPIIGRLGSPSLK